MSFAQKLNRETLRRLNSTETAAIRRFGNAFLRIDQLDGVHDPDSCNTRAITINAVHGPKNDLRRYQRTGSVMNQYFIAISGQCRQSIMYGALTI
mgnify:CR=1 FL=1